MICVRDAGEGGEMKRPTSKDYPVRHDQDGNPLCRWCRGPVTLPKRSWCSNKCVDEFKMETSQGIMRAAVWKRDHGICAACGCDTDRIQNVIDHILQAQFQERTGHSDWWAKSPSDHVQIFADLGFPRSSRSLWEADHILEVVRDGRGVLENLQTLCVPCHKAKTKKLAGERARERRTGKESNDY